MLENCVLLVRLSSSICWKKTPQPPENMCELCVSNNKRFTKRQLTQHLQCIQRQQRKLWRNQKSMKRKGCDFFFQKKKKRRSGQSRAHCQNWGLVRVCLNKQQTGSGFAWTSKIQWAIRESGWLTRRCGVCLGWILSLVERKNPNHYVPKFKSK